MEKQAHTENNLPMRRKLIPALPSQKPLAQQMAQEELSCLARNEPVALATTGRMPNALNDLVVNAHVTKGYKLGVMTSAPFAEPKLMESAARLEAEAVRSQVAQ